MIGQGQHKRLPSTTKLPVSSGENMRQMVMMSVLSKRRPTIVVLKNDSPDWMWPKSLTVVRPLRIEL